MVRGTTCMVQMHTRLTSHTHAYGLRLTPHATHATHSAGPPRAGPLSHLPATIPTYFYTPQGLSRFASDIIIRGFDTPCKLGFYDGALLPKAPPSPRARTSLGPHPHPHLGQPQP